ncbi:MAG TPA: glycosyltransferase family 39 protein [Candidatus Cloacimonadota bacterium]|nr:glycosyltransferase family 39 protein [Candidatus Cloacimonadota bacterium]
MRNKGKLSEKRVIWIIFTLALTLHLAFAIMEFERSGTSHWADSWEYWDIGRQFADGNWYPSRIIGTGESFVVVAPMLPILVAGGILIFGTSFWPIIILNALAAAAMVVVFYLLGRELFSKTTGYLAAGLSMLDVTFYRYITQVLKEPLVYLLVPLTVLFLVKYVKSDLRLRYVAGSAISFTLLIHTDERYFIYTPFILLFLMIPLFRKQWRAIKHLAIWMVILIVTMIPWTIRNYRQFGQVVLLSPRTTAFTSLVWGDAITDEHFQTEITDPRLSPHYASAVEMGRKYGKKPRIYGRYEKYLIAFKHYWQPIFPKLEFQTYGFRPIRWSMMHNLTGMLFYGIFLPFYLLGSHKILRRKEILAYPLVFLPLLHSLLHTFTLYALERYRYAVNFCVVLIGIWMLCAIFQWLKRKLIHTAPADLVGS